MFDGFPLPPPSGPEYVPGPLEAWFGLFMASWIFRVVALGSSDKLARCSRGSGVPVFAAEG